MIFVRDKLSKESLQTLFTYVSGFCPKQDAKECLAQLSRAIQIEPYRGLDISFILPEPTVTEITIKEDEPAKEAVKASPLVQTIGGWFSGKKDKE